MQTKADMTKEEFLKGVSNWDNHRNLLWPALQATDGLVVELGIGDGSTSFLHQYCEDNQRLLISYENNKEWYEKYKHFNSDTHLILNVPNCDNATLMPSVILIDHAPGERRKDDIKKFAKDAKIIVAHDTEPAADHGYKMRAELQKFKYMIDFKSEGAWATAVSNYLDVTKWEI
jgi:hypothetical protein